MIRPEILEEADTIVLTGGEMPEVVMFESLAQLEEQGVQPTPDEFQKLRDAVFQRYQAMVLRDLNTSNRGAAVFRSPQRARINLARMSAFSLKNGFDMSDFKKFAAGMFQQYLERETADINQGKSFNTLGMDRSETGSLMEELGIDITAQAGVLDRIYSVPSLDWQSVRKQMGGHGSVIDQM